MQFYWAETVMLIKIWQLIILYIDRMDWRAGHSTTTEGTGGGAFAKKKLPAGPGIWTIFSNARGMLEGLPGGKMFAAGIDSRSSSGSRRLLGVRRLFELTKEVSKFVNMINTRRC